MTDENSTYDSGSDAIDSPRTIRGEISFTYEATLTKDERVAIDQVGGLDEYQATYNIEMQQYIENMLSNGADLTDFEIDIAGRE